MRVFILLKPNNELHNSFKFFFLEVFWKIKFLNMNSDWSRKKKKTIFKVDGHFEKCFPNTKNGGFSGLEPGHTT